MWRRSLALVAAMRVVGQCAGQCADVQEGCDQFIASGQYSCAESFCPTCMMAANQCDLTCNFCQDAETALPGHEMAAVMEVAVNGVAGFTTYRLYANLPASAANVYTIAGTPDSPLHMPAAYQCASPFGQQLGGVSPLMYAVANSDDLGFAEYDSWLTVGPDDGSYSFASSPGVSDLLVGWSENQGLQISDGAIFWMPDNMDLAPGPGPASVLIAQLTVATGSGFTARAKLQGRSIPESNPDWTESNVHWFVGSSAGDCADSPGEGTTCAIYFSFAMSCATDFCPSCPYAGFCDNSCDFCEEAAAAAAAAQSQIDANAASAGSHREVEAAAIDSAEFSCATSLITNASMTVAEYQALHHDCDNHHDAGQSAGNTCADLVGAGHHSCRTDFCPCCVLADYCNGLCGFCHPEPVPEPEPEAETFPDFLGPSSIGIRCDRNVHGTFIYDCNGMCAAEMWLGDGQCDDSAVGTVGNLACEELQYDDGDCVHLTDESAYVLDCNGVSAPVLLRGDGTCDNGDYTHVDPNTGENVVVNFNCEEHFSDGGDCGGTGVSQLDCVQALSDFTESCDHEGADGMRCNDETCVASITRIEAVYDECRETSGMSEDLLPQIESICGECSPKPELDFCGIVGRIPSASEDCPDDCSEIITLWFEDNFRSCHEGDGFTGFEDSALPGLHAFYRKCRAIYSDTLPWPEPGQCRADEVHSCDDQVCVVANWIGDGFCDGALHCSQHDFDGGDCLELSLDTGSVCSGVHMLGCLYAETEQGCREIPDCSWKSAVQVEGSVYVGITLAMDIADIPAVASTVERQAWETTFLNELGSVLDTRLMAAKEDAACDDSCGKQLRFIGVHAASVLVTIQILPPNSIDLLADLEEAILDSDSMLWNLSLLGQIDPDAQLEYRQVPISPIPAPPSSNAVAPSGETVDATDETGGVPTIIIIVLGVLCCCVGCVVVKAKAKANGKQSGDRDVMSDKDSAGATSTGSGRPPPPDPPGRPANRPNPLQDDGMVETQNPAANMDVEQNKGSGKVYEF